MKQIERLSLIDKIGRELQSRMTYTDIDAYLKGFGETFNVPVEVSTASGCTQSSFSRMSLPTLSCVSPTS
jgi:hypothetical protein